MNLYSYALYKCRCNECAIDLGDGKRLAYRDPRMSASGQSFQRSQWLKLTACCRIGRHFRNDPKLPSVSGSDRLSISRDPWGRRSRERLQCRAKATGDGDFAPQGISTKRSAATKATVAKARAAELL